MSQVLRLIGSNEQVYRSNVFWFQMPQTDRPRSSQPNRTQNTDVLLARPALVIFLGVLDPEDDQGSLDLVALRGINGMTDKPGNVRILDSA